MSRLSITEARRNLSDTVSRVAYGNERVILDRNGKPVAALISVEDLELLERLEDLVDQMAAQESLEEGGEVPWAELKEELNL